MGKMNLNPKPNVVWLEGVLDYFNRHLSYESNDHRYIGYIVGRQIIGLYLIEMILKHSLDRLKIQYAQSHNLKYLFGKLPDSCQISVETKYSQILSDQFSEAWDFARSVATFLEYLGDDPITDTRYFWERERSGDTSIVFFKHHLRPLVYALFIELHNYPEGYALEKRYNTKFTSYKESMNDREKRDRENPPKLNEEREHKRIKPSVYWMEGLLDFINLKFPHEKGDPCYIGFQVGQRMISLYLIEMLLKYALDNMDREFRRSHNLYSLFKKLPRPQRRALERTYTAILNNRVSSTWDFARTVESLLLYTGSDSITETRYFWEHWNQKPTPLSPGPLIPLIYTLFIELHEYPHERPIKKRYTTVFVPLEDSLKKSRSRPKAQL